MDKEKFVELLNGAGKLYGKELDKETLTMWLSFFKDNTTEQFKQAMNEHIKTSKYFPTVADIKEKIYNNKHSKENNSDLWEKLLSAIRNGSYHSEEEFDKLPDLVKIYVRSPRQLQEMAIMDSDVIHSVVKGQFLKQIEAIKENFKEREITSGAKFIIGEEIYKLEEFK